MFDEKEGGMEGGEAAGKGEGEGAVAWGADGTATPAGATDGGGMLYLL